MRFWLTTALSVGLGSGVAAQEVCPYSNEITDMAEFVLTERVALPRLMQARFGDTAVFMQIRYGDGDADAVFERVSQQDGRLPRLLDDSRGAYELTQPNGLESWQTGEPNVLDRFLASQTSELRALLLADTGRTFFDLVSQIKADSIRSENPLAYYSVQFAFLASDQTDEVRTAMAQEAESRGLLDSAAALLADNADRSAFDAFLVRHPDFEILGSMPPRAYLNNITIGVLHGDEPLQGPREGDPEGTASEWQSFTVLKAGLAGMPQDFLGIYVNQSGRTKVGMLAAQALLDRSASGDLDPADNPEEAWLELYEALWLYGGREDAQQLFRGIDWPSKSIRFYAGSAMESLDVMNATRAFTPYMAGETDDIPAMPNTYALTVPWDEWTTIATATRAGSYDDIPQERLPLAVELIWATGAYGDAISLAQERMETDQAIMVMADGMRRLDQKCGDYIGIPGDAVRFGGMAIYKFD